jgi:hypothetical protein
MRHEAIAAQCRSGSRVENPTRMPSTAEQGFRFQCGCCGSVRIRSDRDTTRQPRYARNPLRPHVCGQASSCFPPFLQYERASPRNATWQIARGACSLCLRSGENQTGEARYVEDVASSQPTAKVCRIKRQSPSYTLKTQFSTPDPGPSPVVPGGDRSIPCCRRPCAGRTSWAAFMHRPLILACEPHSR